MQENKQEKSQIKQNILQYLRSKGISEYRFYKDSGVTRGVLQQPNGISEDNLSRFLAYASDVNSDWLLTGNGNMFKTHSIVASSEDIDNDAPLPDTRPRIPFEAAAGTLSIALSGVSLNQCEQIPIIPSLPDYDFSIVARGDSMAPEFLSGDELACAFVNEFRFIQWGRPHVLDTAQGIVLKRIYNNNDHICCRSINPDYPDFDIPKSEIYHLAIVVGLIRHF